MAEWYNSPDYKAFRAAITKSAQEPEFTENIAGVLLTLSKNVLELSKNSLKTSARAYNDKQVSLRLFASCMFCGESICT
jgi:hypothetical protein